MENYCIICKKVEVDEGQYCPKCYETYIKYGFMDRRD